MGAGQKNRSIVIEKVTEEQAVAGTGYPAKTWSTFAKVWASRNDMSGGESFNDAITGDTITAWRIWYLKGVTQKMRIKFEDEVYNITGVIEIGNLKEMIIKTDKQDHQYNT